MQLKGLRDILILFQKGVSAGSTAAFALEGLGGAMEGMKGRMGKFGGFIKGLSVQVGLITAAFKIGSEIFDQVSGVTNTAADAMARVASSGQKAAIRLEQLNPLAQKNIKERAEGVASKAFAITDAEMKNLTMSQKFMLGSKNKIALGQKEANFEGIDIFSKGKLREQLEAGLTQTVVAGADIKEIDAAMTKIRADGFISQQEVVETLDFFDQLITKSNKFVKALEEGKSNLTKDQIEALKKISEEDLKDVLTGAKGNLSNMSNKDAQELRGAVLSSKRDLNKGRGDIATEVKNTQLLTLRKALISEGKKRRYCKNSSREGSSFNC